MIVSHSPWKVPANFERLRRMSDGSSDFRQFRLISESYVWFRIAPFDFGEFRLISESFIWFRIVLFSFKSVLSDFGLFRPKRFQLEDQNRNRTILFLISDKQ